VQFAATSHDQAAVWNANQSLLIADPSSREEDCEEPISAGPLKVCELLILTATAMRQELLRGTITSGLPTTQPESSNPRAITEQVIIARTHGPSLWYKARSL